MSKTKPRNRLFHAVVIVGAGMTGGAAAIACGSSDTTRCTTAADGCYAQIAYNPDAYAHISIDSGGDSYAHIAFNGDANVRDSAMDVATDAPDAPTDADDAG